MLWGGQAGAAHFGGDGIEGLSQAFAGSWSGQLMSRTLGTWSPWVCVLAAVMLVWGPWKVLPYCLCNISLLVPVAGLIGFLFMLRALVAANFNTIYIYTAEVSFGEGSLLTSRCWSL